MARSSAAGRRAADACATEARRCASSPRPTWAPPSPTRFDRLVREFGAEVRIQYDAAAHPPARQGLDVPPRDPLRHGVRRLVQSVPGGAARRRGVERPAVSGRDAVAARQVPTPPSTPTGTTRASNSTTPTAIGTGWTTPSPRPPGGRHARPGHDLPVRSRGPTVPLPADRCWTSWLSSVDVHDRHRNLVVAATGTGKTVIAALDYRRLCEPRPASDRRLLFVAHRKEILEQSLRTYREVLSRRQLR